MPKFIDLTGKTFGRLTVLGPAPRPKSVKNKSKYWKCLCDCQNEVVVNSSCLTRGHTRSCGCLKSERNRERFKKHGMCGMRLHNIYMDMKGRCYNPNAINYKYYGARGIVVCDEWLDKENGFTNFYNWAMTHGYSDELSIDRRDVEGNYEPSNLRWSDKSTQSFNRRIPRNNTSGHIGVYKQPNGKYSASICKNRNRHYLGYFETLEGAIEARERAERELCPECAKKE